jgi:hypothetical protein
MAFLRGHVEGKERVVGDPVLAALRQSQLPDRVLETWLEDTEQSEVSGVIRRFFSSESSTLRCQRWCYLRAS